MPDTSLDEFVPSTPVSSPSEGSVSKLQYQPKLFQYFTPENATGPSELPCGASVSFASAPVSLDLSQKRPQVKTDVPDKPLKGILKPSRPPRPAARRKLTYPPMRKRPIHRKVNFKNALFKVLRKIDPAGTISSKAMDVLNDMICDVMERIASEAATIRAKDKKATLMARDIQTAIRLVLPGAVFTHAFYEAHRALRSFVEWREPADA